MTRTHAGRLALVVCLLGVVTAGCLSPTGDPPPYPQPSFEYEYTRDDGATVLTITAVDDGGLTTEPVRILVGDRVAYVDGSFRPPYTASEAYENEWADGVETGDAIRLTNGTSLEPGVDVTVELRRSDTDEFVAVGTNETVRPPAAD